jgi:hypothetical protein
VLSSPGSFRGLTESRELIANFAIGSLDLVNRKKLGIKARFDKAVVGIRTLIADLAISALIWLIGEL